MKDFLNDFKAFAFKGNMMDLAIGMIIGAAFTALVKLCCKQLVHAYYQLVHRRY